MIIIRKWIKYTTGVQGLGRYSYSKETEAFIFGNVSLKFS